MTPLLRFAIAVVIGVVLAVVGALTGDSDDRSENHPVGQSSQPAE